MPKFATQRHVPFTAAEMFAVVADVERYPEFLPFCSALTVLSRAPYQGGEELVARMSVGYKAIRESFTSRVTTDVAANRIDVAYLDGPFRYLVNRWRLVDDARGSTIDFFIDYEFKSRMLAIVAGAAFDHIFRSFAAAFEKRAAEVYGSRH